MGSNTLILRKFAIDMIRKGNLNKAKRALVKSISIDSTIPDTYTLLGDTLYLLNKPNISRQCYLASMHLKVNKFKTKGTETLSTILKQNLNKLSKEVKAMLPSVFGTVIFDDYTIADHLAHSVIDFKKDSFDPLLKECSKVYKEHIITGRTIESIIDKYSIVLNDYLEFRTSHYVTLGRSILIQNIKWNKIDSDDVISLYLKQIK